MQFNKVSCTYFFFLETMWPLPIGLCFPRSSGSCFSACALPAQAGGKRLPPAHISHEAGLMDGSYSGPASSPCSRMRALCDIDFELLHRVEVQDIPVFSRADDPQPPGLLVLLGTQRSFKFLISIKIRRKNKYHHNKQTIMNPTWVIFIFTPTQS